MEVQQDNLPLPTFHYWLVAGNVIIAQGDSAQPVLVSTTFATEHSELGVYQLGRSQMALQQELFRKLGDNDVSELRVIDVVVTAVSYLGEMPHSVFTHIPDGVGVQEMQDDIVIGASNEPFNPLAAARQADNVLDFPAA